MISSSSLKGKFMGGLMGIVYLSYFVLVLFYMTAIAAGIQEWIGIWFVFACVLGFFIAGIPLLGTAMAIKGAMAAWNWSFLYSAGMFVGIPIAAMVMIGFICKKLDPAARNRHDNPSAAERMKK